MILIIDDEKEITEVVSDMIISMMPQAKVIQVTRPEVVPSLIKDNTVELILLDLLMPDRNGIELMRDIREFSNVPVIIISSIYDVFEDELREFSNTHFIAKPFTDEEIVDQIRRFIL